MIAKKLNNLIEVSFQYDPSLVNFVKSLEGRKFNPGRKVWTLPLANAHDSVMLLQRRGFAIDSDLLEAVAHDKERAEEAEVLAKQEDIEFESPLPLFPFQKVGAAFLHKVGSGLLGDEMGLGKTIQSLAVCEKVGAKKVLIFTPSSVKWQWADELKKFTGKEAIVVEGSPEDRKLLWSVAHITTAMTLQPEKYFIANYELLLRDFAYMSAIDWDVIIADEATRISNPAAKQSKLIKKLPSKRRIAMTGTPVSNKANEIWNIIDFTNPGALGDYWNFLNRYCLKNQWGSVYAYRNMPELQKKIKRYMVRRLKADVLPELPEKISTDVPFPLSVEEKALYKRLKQELLFDIEKTDIDKLEKPMTIQYTLVKMTRLRQLTDSMELLGQNVQSSKLGVLKDLLAEAIVEGRKAIVFTQFAKMADILERELAEYKPLKISGTIKEEYKDVVAKFNEVEEHQVLIMTSAGQFGLNIQRASVIFHYDQEWSLAKMEQREGRAHRMGQKNSVLVYNLLAKGTIDNYVKRVLHKKRNLSNEVLGDTPITMGEIREMLNEEPY